jgi:hypothetical protein
MNNITGLESEILVAYLTVSVIPTIGTCAFLFLFFATRLPFSRYRADGSPRRVPFVLQLLLVPSAHICILPTYVQAVFMAPKGTVAATSPRYVASQAPVYGGVVEAYVASEGQVQVELSAWAAGGGSLSTFIEVAPVYGTVHAVFSDDPVPGEAISQGSLVVDPDPGRAQSKRVWYVPGPEFSETGDTFVYTIRDDAGNRASAEVRISFLEAVAPSARTVSIAEDQRISITLGGASVDSHQVGFSTCLFVYIFFSKKKKPRYLYVICTSTVPTSSFGAKKIHQNSLLKLLFLTETSTRV